MTKMYLFSYLCFSINILVTLSIATIAFLIMFYGRRVIRNLSKFQSIISNIININQLLSMYVGGISSNFKVKMAYNLLNFIFIVFILSEGYKFEEYLFAKYVKLDFSQINIIQMNGILDVYLKDNNLAACIKILDYYRSYIKVEEIIQLIIDNFYEDEIINILTKEFKKEDEDLLYLSCLFQMNNKYIKIYEDKYSNSVPVIKLNQVKTFDSKHCYRDLLIKLNERENFDDFISLNKDLFEEDDTVEYIETLL